VTRDEHDGRAPLAVGLGELIWDLLPTGRRLGGAPSNFAHHWRLLGGRAAVASRVGDDELGREARARLGRAGLIAEHVQIDAEHPTGTVGVEIGARGEARFRVNPNSAWDYLELSAGWARLASEADVVCFGTLGQRHERARETILGFLLLTRPSALRVFDVNLRHSFFTPAMLADSLALANAVKLNGEELAAAAAMLRLGASGERALCGELIERFGLRLVALTRGRRGSLLVSDGQAVEHEGGAVEVVDTIGCGDAFAAAVAYCHRAGLSLEAAGEVANRMGAWVATREGATPEADGQTMEWIRGGAL
jgi:fructokinase